MRHFNLLLAALVFTMSTATFANATSNYDPKEGSMSYEIEKMLTNSNLLIEENFKVKIFFKVTEDDRIEIRSISSPNEKVNEFLKNRLQGQKLKGNQWVADKIYELPVSIEIVR